jgi:acyl-CoA dehydrogenase family protein 9
MPFVLGVAIGVRRGNIIPSPREQTGSAFEPLGLDAFGASTPGDPMNEQSFMKSLFHGVIAEGMIFPYPTAPASEIDNLNIFLDSVRKYFAANVDAAKIDREHTLSPELLAGLKELGLFGMIVPQEYGGVGLTNTGYARVIQEVGGLDASIAVTLAAHQSIGLKGILIFGTEAQKKQYLPKLATGEHVAAFALTEPGAGSDAAAIQTRAEPAVGGWLLNGSKIWITNGGFADVFTVFARTSPAEHGAKPRITAFIVERAFGVKNGPNEHKLGIRASSTTEIFFEDVMVPEANLLGEDGRGFKVAMEVLNSGRLGLASGCLGSVKKLIKLAVERVQERRAFGRPIGEFGLIKDKIAQMMAETYALESMTYMTTGFVDAEVADYSVESAICKVFGSETLWRVVNETLQIAAGIGYMQEYPYERMLRDARINLIFEGTNEILRAFIALSGMQGPGKELVEVAKAMREPIKGFGLLTDFAVRKARSALGRERLTRHHPVLNREAVIFEEYTSELAQGCDKVLRKHGKNIAEMQFTQKRTADIAIDLYGIACVIARTTRAIEKRGEEGARREIDLTSIFVSAAEHRMAAAVAAFDKNDDELRKAVASKTYVDGGYPFDVV